MFTILMQTDKTLVITNKETLLQRENLVDNLCFIIPESYNDVDLSDGTVVMEYTDPANIVHSEILTRETDLYKESYYRYFLPVDTDFTKLAGDNNVRLSITKTDITTSPITQYVLHTYETTITIQPLSDIYGYAPDSSFDAIDARITELNTKLAALDVISQTYAENQVDDLKLTDDLLQVSVSGVAKGNGVKITIPNSDDVADDAADGTTDSVVELDKIVL